MCTKTFQGRLTLGIPKQEKLKTPIIEFLESKGFEISEDGETSVLSDLRGNIPDIRVEFVRAVDALLLMDRKVLDLAIIGSDIMAENTSGPSPRFQKPTEKIDFKVAGCRFELAVPDKQLKRFQTPQDLNGLRIATSYPNMLGEWLKKNNVTPAEILLREGDVESCIRQGLADVVADLVDTGETLLKNKLTSAFEICRTSAVCYARADCDVITTMLVNEFVRNLRAADYGVASPAMTAQAPKYSAQQQYAIA